MNQWSAAAFSDARETYQWDINFGVNWAGLDGIKAKIRRDLAENRGKEYY